LIRSCALLANSLHANLDVTRPPRPSGGTTDRRYQPRIPPYISIDESRDLPPPRVCPHTRR